MSPTVAGSLLVPVPRLAGGVRLSVLIPVVGVLFAPFPGASAASLGIAGILSDFPPAVVAPASPLAFGAAADDLSRTALRGLKGLQAIRAKARRQTNSSKVRFIRKPGGDQTLNVAARSRQTRGRRAEYRNCCRVRTASPPMSSSTTKPGELRSFYSGTDSEGALACARSVHHPRDCFRRIDSRRVQSKPTEY